MWTNVLKMNNTEINKLVSPTYSGKKSSGNEIQLMLHNTCTSIFFIVAPSYVEFTHQ